MPQKVAEIDKLVERDLTQATPKIKGNLTIVEPMGAVTFVLVFLQRHNWLSNDSL